MCSSAATSGVPSADNGSPCDAPRGTDARGPSKGSIHSHAHRPDPVTVVSEAQLFGKILGQELPSLEVLGSDAEREAAREFYRKALKNVCEKTGTKPSSNALELMNLIMELTRTAPARRSAADQRKAEEAKRRAADLIPHPPPPPALHADDHVACDDVKLKESSAN
jgi:hypothetical protein